MNLQFTRNLNLSISFCLIAISSISSFAQDAVNRAAAISVSDTVAARDIEPIGVNLTTITGGTNFATNNFIRGSGMEPGVIRFIARIERFGDGWMEWDQSLGGVHMWDQNRTGFGDGAAVRLYRIVDAEGNPLSYRNGTELVDIEGADHVIFLGETTVPEGGWVAEGSDGAVNRIHLEDNSIELAYGDHAIITVEKTIVRSDEVHPRLLEWFKPNVGIFQVPEGATARLEPHPGKLPEEFTEPGDTCLHITTPQNKSYEFRQYIFHGFDDGEGQWYSQLEPGAPYRAKVWLRQENIPNGDVRFACSGPYRELTPEQPWKVTGEWAKYTYDFTGPAYPSPSGYHASFGLLIEGKGDLWVDNFVVYRNDAQHGNRPFTPHRLSFDELMSAMPPSGPKPAVRFYEPIYSGHSPMKRMLSNYPSSRIDFIYNIQAPSHAMSIPHCLEWSLATGESPNDRVVPYLTLSEEYTEVEWVQLMEYLGVPYDPDSDTPEEKPWAYLRHTQRGGGVPWTDEFREIVIEIGNETWHAGVLAGWDGFGKPGWVHHGGAEYGLFANYYFQENAAAHPWWKEYNLGEKIRFALNGNYDADPDVGYGELAAKRAPKITSYVGHANYVGPKWETEEEQFKVFDAHGMQETIVGGYLGMFPLIDQVKETRDEFAENGTADYRPIAYEGGPSGYSLPGKGNDESAAIAELYGKSVGMAVSALDTWLYSSLRGYDHQCLYAFSSGKRWKSHTMPRAGGFRQHTGWLALKMRNLYAPGDEMLETTLDSVPSYERSGNQVPLVSAYTIHDNDTYSVFVLNRKIPGEHDGVDFGDGITPVTIRLPFEECRAITRYALTAPDGSPVSPSVSNTEKVNVSITSVSIEPSALSGGVLEIGPETGGVEGGMAPGTIYLYVFKKKQTVSINQWKNI